MQQYVLDKILILYDYITNKADQSTRIIEEYIGIQNTIGLFIGIKILGTLIIIVIVQQFNYDYRQLLGQYGFVLILHSLLLAANQKININPIENSQALKCFIFALLNSIGMATFFAILPDTDILLVMMFYNFKYFIINSAKQENTKSSILFILGFLLTLMNNQSNLEIWILILGQICQTGSELMSQHSIDDINQASIQFFRGITMIIVGLLNYKTVTLGDLNDFDEITLSKYLIIFIIPCLSFRILDYCGQNINKQNNEKTENVVYGIQVLILLFYDKITFMGLFTAIIYFLGIGLMFIKQINQ